MDYPKLECCRAEESTNVIENPEYYKFNPDESSLVQYAKSELDAVGMTEDSNDEMNVMMRKHIIHMVTEFAREGHSGFSAGYAINALTKLFDFKPLSPLTGKDDEWNDVGENTWQNKRCGSIFKNSSGEAWDIDGRVFWQWYPDEETGEQYKSYFTNYFSRVPVEFPYTPPTKPIYEEWTEEWDKKEKERFK